MNDMPFDEALAAYKKTGVTHKQRNYMIIGKEFKHAGVSVKIVQDEDASNPQEEHDKGLFLVASHRDFYVPEPGEKRCRETFNEYVRDYERTHWIFPIEAYIHSGVRLAMSHTGNFPDRQWDVSQVGAIFAAKSEWRLSKSARKAAEGYMEAWNQYLSGDVWGYIIGEETPFEESCWGFYGLDYCEQEAKSIAEYVADKVKNEETEAQRCACADIVTA